MTPRLRLLCLVIVAQVFCVVAFCVFAPRLYAWGFGHDLACLYFPEGNRAIELLHQLYYPAAAAISPSNKVIEWRLLLPVVCHALHTPWQVYFALPFVFAYLLVAGCALWVHARTQSFWAGVCAAAFAATSSVFFISTGFWGYFDSALMLAIIGAIVARHPMSLLALGALAPWIDERFILALPIIFWCRWALGKELRPLLWTLAGFAPYLALRVWALAIGGDHSGGYLQTLFEFRHEPINLWWGLWDSLRWGWVLAVAAPLLAGGKLRLWGIVLLPATLAVHLLIAGDYSRSLGIALPLVMTGLILAWKQPRAIAIISLLVLANFATPAYHSFRAFRFPILPMPLQLKLLKAIQS